MHCVCSILILRRGASRSLTPGDFLSSERFCRKVRPLEFRLAIRASHIYFIIGKMNILNFVLISDTYIFKIQIHSVVWKWSWFLPSTLKRKNFLDSLGQYQKQNKSKARWLFLECVCVCVFKHRRKIEIGYLKSQKHFKPEKNSTVWILYKDCAWHALSVWEKNEQRPWKDHLPFDHRV